MKYLFLMLVLAVLIGCEQRYRYACQDPANWETKQCQKPICEVNQDCPEHVFNGQKAMETELKKEPANDCPK